MDLGVLENHMAGTAKCLQPVEPLKTDLLGENTKNIISRIVNMSEDLGSLTKTVYMNKKELVTVRSELRRQADTIDEQRGQLMGLGDQIRSLEQGTSTSTSGVTGVRSDAFLKAIRSVTLWPIDSENEDILWQAVGDFLHKTLETPETDVCPDNIEATTLLPGRRRHTGRPRQVYRVTRWCT